jgi:hypothetical protein
MRANVCFLRNRLTTFRAMRGTTRTNDFLKHNEVLWRYLVNLAEAVEVSIKIEGTITHFPKSRNLD